MLSGKEYRKVLRTLSGVFVCYLIFVIYGSLVPLEFQAISRTEALRRFSEIPWLDLGIASRADWVANCLLFIPLAFLAQGVVMLLTGYSHRGMGLVLGLSIWFGCALLAVWIEFTQIFFPPRTVSLNDIVAETLGALLGSVLWYWRGKQLLQWLHQTFRVRRPRSVAQRLFYGYATLYVFFQLLPLDLTISPVEIYHQWRMGKVVLLPFQRTTHHYSQWLYNLATDILFFIPIGFLAVRSGWISGSLQRRILKAASYGLAISLLVEFLQLFVYSRVSDTTDLITATIGAGIGAVLSRNQPTERVSATRSRITLNLAWLWLALYCLLLVTVFWLPFNFGVSRQELMSGVHRLRAVPFYSYYYSTEFVAMSALLRQLLFFVPLGFLLHDCVHRWSKTIRRLFSFVVLLSMAAAVELGQLFIPERIADNTDIVIGLLGGIAGMTFHNWLHKRGTVKYNPRSYPTVEKRLFEKPKERT